MKRNCKNPLSAVLFSSYLSRYCSTRSKIYSLHALNIRKGAAGKEVKILFLVAKMERKKWKTDFAFDQESKNMSGFVVGIL